MASNKKELNEKKTQTRKAVEQNKIVKQSENPLNWTKENSKAHRVAEEWEVECGACEICVSL